MSQPTVDPNHSPETRTDRSYRFGDYCLIPRQRALLAGNEPVHIGSRAFGLLLTLVEQAGTVVSSQELMRKAWPGVVVEEANLRVQIGMLRKLLHEGDDKARMIETVPLQGYCFVMPVQVLGGDVPAQPARGMSKNNLPVALVRMVGRDQTVDLIVSALATQRLVTIAGPGGMGKTTVALEVAHKCLHQFADGVIFVDFSPVSDQGLVVSTVASRLGIGVLSDSPLDGLLAHLSGKRALLVFDTCEHLVEAVACLAEALLAQLPQVSILATSRETLRSAGEWVHRLQPLEVPAMGTQLRAAEALTCSAVSLLVQRVAASVDGFELRDSDTAVVSSICRQLDGIPLAIELAAARVEEMGLREVAARLDDRFAVLNRGRRTALPRHQTLSATLEWSFDLLSEQERRVLRNLSVFLGAFTADAARTVAMSGMDARQAATAFSGLHLKSLMTANIGRDVVRYRLLDTTRLFAAEKLEAAGEAPDACRRHAQYLLETARTAEGEWELKDSAEWMSLHAYLIDDVRSALNWTFSDRGDRELAVDLTASSSPLWFALSLMEEYRRYIERALAAVEAGVPAKPTTVFQLWNALGHANWHARGNLAAMSAAFSQALALAERENRRDDKLRALWGRMLFDNTNGDYLDSLATLEEYGALIAGVDNESLQLTYQRMAALSLHYAGYHARARVHAQFVLDHPSSHSGKARRSGLQFDQRITAKSMLARILWMQGDCAQAWATAREGFDLACETAHAVSECFVLATAVVPIALWNEDREVAAQMTDRLLVRSREHSFEIWNAFGRGYESVLRRLDQPSAPIGRNSSVGTHLFETLATVDPSVADEALFERAERGLAGWSTPELLRIRAERARARGAADTEVEAMLLRALEVARQQGAVAWERRIVQSLAVASGSS